MEMPRSNSTTATPEQNISFRDSRNQRLRDLSESQTNRDNVSQRGRRSNSTCSGGHPHSQHEIFPAKHSQNTIELQNGVNTRNIGSSEAEPRPDDHLIDVAGREISRQLEVPENTRHVTFAVNSKPNSSKESQAVRVERLTEGETQGIDRAGIPSSYARKRRTYSNAEFEDISDRNETLHAEKRAKRDRSSVELNSNHELGDVNPLSSFETERPESSGQSLPSEDWAVEGNTQRTTPPATITTTDAPSSDLSPPAGTLLRVEVPGISGLADRIRSFVGSSSH